MDAKQKEVTKKVFKSLCLSGGDDEDKRGRIPKEYVTLFIASSMCRHCGKEVSEGDFAIHNTYWQSLWAPCHAGCRDAGMKEEAYECQTVDADCNDCKHFVRGALINKWAWAGHCSKHDRPTHGLPNFCSGHP
jgi:hypothetical protein